MGYDSCRSKSIDEITMFITMAYWDIALIVNVRHVLMSISRPRSDQLYDWAPDNSREVMTSMSSMVILTYFGMSSYDFQGLLGTCLQESKWV